MQQFSWSQYTKPHPSTLRYCFMGKKFMVRLSTIKTTKILPPEKYLLYGSKIMPHTRIAMALDVFFWGEPCLCVYLHNFLFFHKRVPVSAFIFWCCLWPHTGDVESGCKLYVFKGQRRRSQGRRKGRRGGKAVGGGGTSEDREAVGHSGHVLALAISSDGKYLVGNGK